MNTKLPELSVFFPFWNEEENIEKVVEGAIPTLKDVAKEWEIIMVNDGSSDRTEELGKKLAKKYRNVRLINHTPNRGYGAALKTGLTSAKYKYIAFTDGDGQFEFKEIAKFIDAIKGHDLVIGYRKKRRDHNLWMRLLLMYLLKAWDFLLFRFYVKDIDCGFKLFKKGAVEQMMPLRAEGAMITTEILAKAKAKNMKIAQVGVEHYPRKFGQQSGSNLQVIVRAIFESLLLWWDIKYKRF